MESKLPEPGGTTDEDVISSLPDDVLLRILSFVPTEDAVCTRALSRRWRHVWLCLPDLAFSDIGKTPTSGLDAVLAHSHDTFTIHIQHPRHKLRANAWLQQAAERVHGKISLRLDDYRPITIEDRQWYWYRFGNVELDLPCGGDARTAAMSFCSFLQDDKVTILRLPAAPAANSSLTELELVNIQLEVGSLSDFLSSCGQLRRLLLDFIWVIDGPDLRISNKLLEDLDLDYISGGVERLEVSCPKLRSLRINRHFAAPDCEMVARFCTPCLEEIYWPYSDTLRKSRVEFLGSMDMVRRLNVGLLTHVHVQTYQSCLGLWLVRSCTGVHRLDVSLWNRTKVGNNLNSGHHICIYCKF
jgi:hypothetical protein